MTYTAYRFSKSGKWHLLNPKTGKISCIRFKNKSLDQAVDEKEGFTRDDKDVCGICTGMLHDQQMQEEIDAYEEKCRAVSNTLFVQDLERILNRGN